MSELFYRAAGAIAAPFRYAEREAKALKEHVKEDVQAYVAIFLKLAMAGVAAILFLLFISIALATWINIELNSDVAGFAIVAGFYLIIAICIYILKLSDDKSRKRKAESKKPVIPGI